MSKTVTACPHCDSHRISVNSGSDMNDSRNAPPFRCRECHEGFDEPRRRPPRNSQGSREPSGLAGRLLNAEPDEVSG